MQREREGRDDFLSSDDPLDSFRGFGLFGSRRNVIPSLFEGKGPFDDPFFTRPFESMFESSAFGHRAASSDKLLDRGSKGLVIEELNSDEEKEEDEGDGDQRTDDQRNYGSNSEPTVEHPDDTADERKNNGDNNSDHGRSKTHSNYSVQTCKVTYGGVDGAYYTSSRTRRADSGGVMLEETKEADRTTGQATHRISRGIHDKGHSVTRKLNSDGNVDTLQTLHNLGEDELAGFEDAWKSNVQGHLPVFKDGSDIHGGAGSSSRLLKEITPGEGWAFPSVQSRNYTGRASQANAAGANSSAGRTKKVVRINIE